MAVSRVEWECPGCRRKFAIPANQPRPELCPNCRAPARGGGPLSEPEVEFGAYQTTPNPVPLVVPAQAMRPIKRRRYAELQGLSLALKVLAVIVGLMTLVQFGETAVMMFDLPSGELRRLAVYTCFGILLGGTIAALVLYSFAVLLLVAVEVEFNTRPE